MTTTTVKPPRTQGQRNARNGIILLAIAAILAGWLIWNGSHDSSTERKLQNLDAAEGHHHDLDAYKNTWSMAMEHCTQTSSELETLIENVLPTLRQRNPDNRDRLALLINISLSVGPGPKVDCAPLLSGARTLPGL